MTKSIDKSSQRKSKHRKSVTSDRLKYEPYWDGVAVAEGIAAGKLLIGQIRINPKQYKDAYICHPNGDADIYIPGTKARNRALNSDMVVVCLEPIKSWRVYEPYVTRKVMAALNKCDKSPKSNSVTVGEFWLCDRAGFELLFANIEGGLMTQLENSADPKNFQPSLKPRDLTEAAQLPWWQLIQRVGRVVAIHRYLNCRVSMGYLNPPGSIAVASANLDTFSTANEEAPKKPSTGIKTKKHFAIFSPIDSKMPRIVIPIGNCPVDFLRQPESFKHVRFVAKVTDWPEDSVYARGQLVRRFDDVGTSYIAAETERILINCGFPYGLSEVNRFPEAVEAFVAHSLLPAVRGEPFPSAAESRVATKARAHLSLPLSMTEEVKRRRDYRSACVFTIDPRTARDLDDALHVRRLSPEEVKVAAARGARGAVYEVGVHIADVSFFVRPGDPVDVEAAERCTSIYLVQICVPMLPRLLGEDLCSLNPGTDKLTFSVVFLLNEEAKVLSKWYGRTVIRSRAKLSYEDAQSILDDPNRDWKPTDINVSEGADVKEICRSVVLLNELSVQMRKRRFANGALQLSMVKPVFTLSEPDTDGALHPLGVAPFIAQPANRLVEEWMLAVNEAVADLLTKNLPRTALLRRHPPPTRKQIAEVHSILRCVGVDVNIKTAGDIQRSLNELSGCTTGMGWQHSDKLAQLCAAMSGCSLDSSRRLPSPVGSDQTTASTDRTHLSEEAHLLATLTLLTKCMSLAEYYCLGAALEGRQVSDGEFFGGHYALNMATYTHFTSPIRRYADLVVHRQLAQVLAINSTKEHLTELAEAYNSTCDSQILHRPDQLAAIAEVCNARKLESRRAGEESVEVFFTALVKECGPFPEACSVVNVLNQSFDVLILSVGVIKRVYLNDLDLSSYGFERNKSGDKGMPGVGTLLLRWHVRPPVSFVSPDKPPSLLDIDPAVVDAVPPSPAPPCDCFEQTVRLFDLLKCCVSVEQHLETPSSAGEETTGDQSIMEGTNTGGKGLPRLKVTLIRPTCRLCEDFGSAK